MKTKIIVIILLITAIGLFFGVIIPKVILTQSNQYYGKEVFTTEQGYDTFKQELVNSNAIWSATAQSNSYVQALSSDPPIIVRFSVFVAKDINFPYGKKSNGTTNTMIWGSVIFILIIAGIYLIPGLWKEDMAYLFKWKEEVK